MNTQPLRLAIAQCNPIVGDLKGNSHIIRTIAEQNRDADLIVYSECVLTGYPLEDLVLRPAFLTSVRHEIDELAKFVRALAGPALLIGAPTPGANLPFNSALLIRTDGSITTTHKVELPNNDVFDEVRTFAQGPENVRPMPFKGFNLGVMICEDMWHNRVSRRLSGELADLLIVLNGSPFERFKQATRIAHARRRVGETCLPLVYVNQVGGTDEICFDGASFALSRAGSVIAQIPFEERVIRLLATRQADGHVDIEPEKDALASHVQYPDDLEAIYRACCLGLGDYMRKNAISRALVGESGGLDSALVSAMLVDALGPNALIGVSMPSDYTSKLSLDLAEDLCRRLEARLVTVPISKPCAVLSDGLDTTLSTFDGINPRGISIMRENLQARTRANILLDLANALGAIVLATGNKSEGSVGNSTYGGDTSGGFNPLKDLYKTIVFALARWRNENRPDWVLGPVSPIPVGIIERPPSAELMHDQTDESLFGSYDTLDTVLELLIEDLLDPEAAAQAASRQLEKPVGVEYARDIALRVRNSEFKRRQAPPGVKITRRAFGKGWRYPITNHARF